MARVYGIKKRLEQRGFDEASIKEIIGNGNLIGIIERMEKLLEYDVMQEILDSCACGGGSVFIKHCQKIGKEILGRPLSEKIKHINETSPDSENIELMADDIMRGTLSFGEDGKHKCACSAAVKKGVTVSQLAENGESVMPLSYCLCCAGSFRRHLEMKLGIGLKTKAVVSSPINSGGEQPCEFVYEISPRIDGKEDCRGV